MAIEGRGNDSSDVASNNKQHSMRLAEILPSVLLYCCGKCSQFVVVRFVEWTRLLCLPPHADSILGETTSHAHIHHYSPFHVLLSAYDQSDEPCEPRASGRQTVCLCLSVLLSRNLPLTLDILLTL